MKRTNLISKVAGIGLGIAGLMMIPMMAQAQIAGTAHDFSGDGWSGGRICEPCHTPHNSDTTVPNAPLWNHEVSTATYQTYVGSGTLDAATGQPSGVSLLCLSCHDGSVAIDSFGGNTGSNFIGGGENLGTDLRNDHPISFTYDTALATTDGALADPATTTAVSDLLFNGQMECASCHDVHGNGNSRLLTVVNTGSALCLTCHTK